MVPEKIKVIELENYKNTAATSDVSVQMQFIVFENKYNLRKMVIKCLKVHKIASAYSSGNGCVFQTKTK